GPLSQTRAVGREERGRPRRGGRYPLQLVHDGGGTVFCYDRVSKPPVRHKMSYVGHEEGRGTVRYRCPARHEGWECPSDAKCNAGRDWGLTARIPCELDLRRFPPIPRATKEFGRRSRGRPPRGGATRRPTA